MLEKIIEIISSYAKIEVSLINDETNILELDVDSLTILKIIMDVEQTFSIRFEDEEIVDIRTAKDIENIVFRKIV
ncbi:MAG: acyl carrier protein [Clostridia bacterium]|nr:acyl carrier protein [Clostridia bacterium]